MLFGGQCRDVEDIDFLRDLEFDLGEVALSSEERRKYWLKSGVKNQFDSGFFLVAHAPREGPPNDPAELWNIYYPALKETVDAAHEMGIALLTIHMWMDARFVRALPREEKKKALNEIVAYARDRNVLICIENLSENAQDLAAVLQAVPGLRITLDVGHGQLLTETNTSFAIIDELYDSIRHVHLHDNRGGSGVKDDLHLPIGEGIVDFPRILGNLLKKGYRGTATLELEREVLQSSLKTVREIIAQANCEP